MDGKRTTLFDGQLLAEGKIKLKTLLDDSMYHTSLSGERNIKFQTLLLGKSILTVTIRLTSKSVPPPQPHPTSVFCEL